jgi:sigma-E factor negative regulatory protein RseC
MSQEIVKVTEIADGGVWVEAVQRSACNSCNARSGCGQHSLSKLGRPMRLWVAGGEHLQAGQEVVLSIPSGGLALSALLLYGLPLLGLIVGMALGQSSGDLLAAIVGLTGLAAGFFAARRISEQVKHRWEPRIVPGCALIPHVEVK